jgi:hypothetical protein
MITTTIYLQSGATTLTVFSDASSYHTPSTNPCSLPDYKFAGTAQNSLTIDSRTG